MNRAWTPGGSVCTGEEGARGRHRWIAAKGRWREVCLKAFRDPLPPQLTTLRYISPRAGSVPPCSSRVWVNRRPPRTGLCPAAGRSHCWWWSPLLRRSPHQQIEPATHPPTDLLLSTQSCPHHSSKGPAQGHYPTVITCVQAWRRVSLSLDCTATAAPPGSRHGRRCMWAHE